MAAVEEYVEIGAFIDAGLRRQIEFDLEAFIKAAGRPLSAYEAEEFRRVQLRTNRWTYPGSGMTHRNFLRTLEALTPAASARIEQLAPAFC